MSMIFRIYIIRYKNIIYRLINFKIAVVVEIHHRAKVIHIKCWSVADRLVSRPAARV